MTAMPGHGRLGRYLYVSILILTVLLLLPPVSRTFAFHALRWLYVLLISTSFSFCLMPLCIWTARRFGVLDVSDVRKAHGQATPLLGGAAVFMGFLAAVYLNGIFNPDIVVILTAALLVFLVGLADDVFEVSAGLKLAAQVAAVLLVVSQGVVLRVVPEQLGLFAQAANLGLTFFWIIGITNAMNFFDGMNGLAAGLGALIAFFLCLVAYQTGQPFVGWFSLAVMGGCLGFLPYNLRAAGRASAFLGDAGSTVIGFILACIAVYGVWSVDRPVVALISPLLIFWVLIFDMIYITVERIASGKVADFRQWLEYVGRDHLHHRLATVLGSPVKSVVFIFALNGSLGISAVVLRQADTLGATLLLGQAVLLVLLVSVLEVHARTLRREASGTGPDRVE